MSSFHEFHEPIAVETPLGPGRAILVERTPHDYLWTVALETRALVSFTQDRIRICKSYTHSRGISDEQMREIVKMQGSSEFRGALWDKASEQATRDILAEPGAETETVRQAWERDVRAVRHDWDPEPGGMSWQAS